MASSGAKWQSEDGHSERLAAALFIGESRHPVDPKNRVFLPKRFQTGLPLDEEGNRAGVLMRGLDGCIYLFTKQGHTQATSMVNMEAFAPRRQRNRQRALLRSGHDFTLDASGRLLLPAHLIEIAGIDRDVVLVGVGRRIEIWAADRWDALEAENEAAFEELENLITDEPGGQGG
jgi:MraZ protein